ncbi:MAG: 2-isopropylmalate synthase [Acidimicrobiia bacterium]|nr:2-isopropylmalate synthase [Acidimicrobiia bacterium]
MSRNGFDPDRVVIFDTTLRDGEQSPGIALNVMEKIEIAEQLQRLGVDVIEAGFPISSPGDFEAVEAIAQVVTDSTVCGLARTGFEDIDRAWQAVRHAPNPRIHVFIATSPIHMERKLQMTPEQVKGAAVAGVARAKSYCDDVEFSPEDGTRSDPEFMVEVLQAVVDAGAVTLNIPDTVGYTTPDEFHGLIAYVVGNVQGPDNLRISTHCHNDLGLAVANSLAAIAAGARQVECTINGIGERAGNAAMEEIVMALRTRDDTYGVDTVIDTSQLARTSRLVSRLTGYPVQYNKAVVGRNAFAHEAGIHQHGVLTDKRTYEIMDAESVGQATEIVLGKHSGRHAFSDALEKMGLKVQGDVLNQAFIRFKELADRKVQITEADLEAIVAEELGVQGDAWQLVDLVVMGGLEKTPTASVQVKRNGDRRLMTAEGDGMIDAACQAIRKAIDVECRLVDFNVSSVTSGVDALGDVTVQVESEGLRASGRGVSTDVVEASARAYLSALNKIVRAREHPEKEEVEGESGP